MDTSKDKKHASVQKRKSRIKSLKNHFLEYITNSSLHGMRYTTEKTFHPAERAFWVVTILLSIGMCMYLIHNVWHKWQTSPVIVSFSEKIVPVETVPFPTLTICPQIKAKATVFNYTKHFTMYFNESLSTNVPAFKKNVTTKMTPHEMKNFLDASLICPLPFYLSARDFDYEGPEVTNASTINTLLEISPNISYIDSCHLLGVKQNCSEMFATVLTDEGVCFTFNGLAADEIFRTENIQRDYSYNKADTPTSGWSLKSGYDNSDDVDYLTQYPHRGQYLSHRPYLEVMVNTRTSDYDDYCNVITKGYKVYVQHPANHPQSSVYSYAILPGQLSAISLKVNMMNTSEKLMKYDAETRQCFFSSEKYLRYFKLYTASNCLLECMSNYTYKMCQCVPFHMPHTDSESICTMRKAKCLTRAGGANRKLLNYINGCNCLPNCNSVSYEAEILKTEFNYEKSVKNFLKIIGYQIRPDYHNKYEYSKLEVYYRDSGFVTITRSELFGVTDFLANIGGLLGLFLGFSFLSLVEIGYFFSIRLAYTFREEITSEEKDPEKASTQATDLDANGPSKIEYI